MISTLAPAVKPTMTALETKRTNRPSLARPRTTRSVPPMTASNPAANAYCSVPGTTSGASAARVSSEAVLLGPVCRWLEEPNTAAARLAMTTA